MSTTMAFCEKALKFGWHASMMRTSIGLDKKEATSNSKNVPDNERVGLFDKVEVYSCSAMNRNLESQTTISLCYVGIVLVFATALLHVESTHINPFHR
jgi:hypothetical protein